MADPIQTARIVEAMARSSYERAPAATLLNSGVHIIPWEQLSEDDRGTYRDDAQAALSTAYPMLREEMARIADDTENDVFGEYDDRSDGYRDGCRESAATIRATELAKGEE